MSVSQNPTPIKVLKAVFGQKPGQGLLDFKKEVDELKASCSEADYFKFIGECRDYAEQAGIKIA